MDPYAQGFIIAGLLVLLICAAPAIADHIKAIWPEHDQ